MKLKYLVTAIVIIIFLSLNLIFSENDAQVDGFTIYGWPYNFYVQTEARLTDPSYADQLGFFPTKFAADLFILCISIMAANIVVIRIRQGKQ